jgi:DNA-binding winged helix-turn-helix (wHTH) protein/tetratricopeptide (TPR) repeat protein
MPSAADRLPEPHAWRFAGFDLRPRQRQLLRDGKEVHVQAKVFDLIAYLVAHHSKAVDKNELLDAIWPRQVVTEAALSRAVMKARRVLGDDAVEPRILQTVHGRGFRVLAHVVRIEQAEAAPAVDALPPPRVKVAELGDELAAPSPAMRPGAEAPSAAAPSRAYSNALDRPRLWLLGSALLLLFAAGLWLMPGVQPEPEVDHPLRVAILPFENATGEAALDWAPLALMGSIAELLRLSENVPVLGEREILDLDAALSDLRPAERIARLRSAYGVSHLVDGRLERQAGKLRLNYALTGTDGHPRGRTAVAADVGGIAKAVAADLRAVLGSEREQGPVSQDEFVNEAYLRGRARQLQGDSLGALELYRLAIEQSPAAFWPRFQRALALRDLGDSAQAETELAALLAEVDAQPPSTLHIIVRHSMASVEWRLGHHARAGELLEEALALVTELGAQDYLADVHASIGLLASLLGDSDRARNHLGRSIDAERAGGQQLPSGNVLVSLGNVERRSGNAVAAEAHLQQALLQFRLLGDRRNEAVALSSLSALRQLQGRYPEARDAAAEALAVHRTLGSRSHEVTALYALAVAEAELGRLSAAIVLAEEALALAEEIGERPRAAQTRSLLGQFERDLGRYGDARARFERAAAEYAADGDSRQAERQRYHLVALRLASGAADVAEEEALELLTTLQPEATLRNDVLRTLIRARLDRGDHAGAAEAIRLANEAIGDTAGRGWAWLQLLVAEYALAVGDLQTSRSALGNSEPVLGRRHEFLRVAAAVAALDGDPQRALDFERAGELAAGERWSEQDVARLASREAASAKLQ